MTNQIPRDWNVYRSWLDDDPAVFRLNLALNEVAPLEGFSYCVRITIELKNPDKNGFSSDEERPTIYAIEDQILRPLQSDKDILVAVLTGKSKGKRGKVTKVLSNGKVIVEGVNIITKHEKPVPALGKEGGLVKKEAAIDVSNVAIFNPTTNKADRVGFRFEDGKKVRFFKSNNEII